MWRIWISLNVALAMSIVSLGCRSRQIRDPDFPGVVSASAQAAQSPAPAAAAIPPVAPVLTGPQPVEVYINYALSQNPDIEVTRKPARESASWKGLR